MDFCYPQIFYGSIKWIKSKIVGFQLCFVSYLCFIVFGNQYCYDKEPIAFLAGMEQKQFLIKFVFCKTKTSVRGNDFFETESETNAVFSKGQNFIEEKYHHCTVEVYRSF